MNKGWIQNHCRGGYLNLQLLCQQGRLLWAGPVFQWHRPKSGGLCTVAYSLTLTRFCWFQRPFGSRWDGTWSRLIGCSISWSHPAICTAFSSMGMLRSQNHTTSISFHHPNMPPTTLYADRLNSLCELKINPPGLIDKANLPAKGTAWLSASVAGENGKTTTLQTYSLPSGTSIQQQRNLFTLLT